MSLGMSVVDVSTESMEGSTTLFVMLATGDFSATDTAGDRNLNTLGTGTHSGDDGVLDGAAILHTTLNLLCDILGNKNSIELGALHLRNVNLDVLASEFLQFFFQFVDLAASLADDQTRTSGVDSHGKELKSSLDVNLRDAGLGETGIEIFADFVVLDELLLESAAAKPVRIPSADDASTISNWVSFLSHC